MLLLRSPLRAARSVLSSLALPFHSRGRTMYLIVSNQLITSLSLLGVLTLGTACGSSNTGANPNGPAGAGGLSR